MDDHGLPPLTIGELARRTGLPVRTIRYWSDIGAVPPVGRSGAGHRLYDATSVARLELVRTLRQLGLGLADIQRVLRREASLAQVAAVHVAALDARIRTLRLSRAVLATVATRGSSTEELALMNHLARLSAQERARLIDDFLDEVLGGPDAGDGVLAHLRQATPNLPDDPTPEQVDAWVELAELVQDPGFRRGIRALATYTARQRARAAGPTPDQPSEVVGLARLVAHHGGAALERGVAPESAEGAAVLGRILGDGSQAEQRAAMLERLELAADPRGERYWRLVGVINGWPPYPDSVPSIEHVTAGLRAHGWALAALRAHR